ncbi:MAG: Coenzyme F420 hydrogenase/dehydrogenase, beta subunit C-terminal domain [Desulfobacterium sp.]|nr:Coenzyme F420 hydrogenase/dehydrogenase, beta subunit C-terminal domain [Desulfobacterium sp.]
MNNYTKNIRKISSNLLEDGRVDLVLGFKRGTLPMASVPGIARTPEEAQGFVWDTNCRLNLANYITDQKEKIGIIAKGCDSRNIVNHIMENKIPRDQVYIIGVPCTGMVDKNRIRALLDDEIKEFKEEGEVILIRGAGQERVLDKEAYLRDNCKICTHRNPVIHDDLVGALVKEQKIEDPFRDVAAIEAMEGEERWNHFEGLLSNCIRCYACRNACPLCYCPACFVDESKPQWIGKGQDPTDIRTFHFLRAYHCAGRCTDCGACEEACPMDIQVRDFTRKLVKDSFEIYGWEPGLTLDRRPPLETFKPEDSDKFIK